MLAVVNKNKRTLSLYSTLPAWFVYHQHKAECGIIELVPNLRKSGSVCGVDQPKDLGVDPAAGGRKRFRVELGFPITTISVDELDDEKALNKKKVSLRKVLDLGAQSARYAQMQTPFFWWFNLTIRGGFICGDTNPDGYNGGLAWWVGTCKTNEQLAEMMRGLAPALMSAALLFRNVGRRDLLNAIAPAMLLLPPGAVFPEVMKALPEIYGNVVTSPPAA